MRRGQGGSAKWECELEGIKVEQKRIEKKIDALLRMKFKGTLYM